MLKQRGLLFVSFMTPFLFGFLPPKHSSVRVKLQKALSGHQSKLEFAVVPAKKMQITDEGPWKLQITQIKGMKIKNLTKDTYLSTQFDKQIPGFSLSFEPSEKPIQFEYKLNSFICTEDKKRCFPETHKGTYPPKK